MYGVFQVFDSHLATNSLLQILSVQESELKYRNKLIVFLGV